MIPALGLGAFVAWWLKPCKKVGACADAAPSVEVSELPPAVASTRESITVKHAPYVPPPERAAAPPLAPAVNHREPVLPPPPLPVVAPVPPPRAPYPNPAPAPVPVVIPPRPAPTYNYVPTVQVVPRPAYVQTPNMPSYNYVPTPRPVVTAVRVVPPPPPPPPDPHPNIYITTAGNHFEAHWIGAGYFSSHDDTGETVGTTMRTWSVPGRADNEVMVVLKQAGVWVFD